MLRIGHASREWTAPGRVSIQVALATIALSAIASLPGIDAVGAARAATCGGAATTVNKADGGGPISDLGDVVDGTKAPDVIAGLGGNDRVSGYGASDKLCGDNGADDVFGGSGRDVIYGGVGSDVLRGGRKGDKIYADPLGLPKQPKTCYDKTPCHVDDINGGTGNDYLVGGFGPDELDGGAGKKDVCITGPDGGKFKNKTPGCEIVKKKPGAGASGGGGGQDLGALTPTTTTLSYAVNDIKDLVHVWGTTTPHAGADTVYVVIQHKSAAGEWYRVKWGCFGFGSDGRYEHTFGLGPAANYRVQARYRAPECPAVANRGSASPWAYFNVN